MAGVEPLPFRVGHGFDVHRLVLRRAGGGGFVRAAPLSDRRAFAGGSPGRRPIGRMLVGPVLLGGRPVSGYRPIAS